VWIITPRGFYSAVAKPTDGDESTTVRARSERDVRKLADLIDAESVRSEDTDYRWRIRCRKEEWARAVAVMAQQIDYPNFKNRIASENAASPAAGAGVERAPRDPGKRGVNLKWERSML
jgi:hypothetical protein